MKNFDYLMILAIFFLDGILSNFLRKSKKIKKRSLRTAIPGDKEGLPMLTMKEWSLIFVDIFHLPPTERDIKILEYRYRLDHKIAYENYSVLKYVKFESGAKMLKEIMDSYEREFIDYANTTFSFKLSKLENMAAKAEANLHATRIYELSREFNSTGSSKGKKLFERALEISEEKLYSFFEKTLVEIREESIEAKKVKLLTDEPEKLEFIIKMYAKSQNNPEMSGQFKMCEALLNKYHFPPK